MGAVTFESFKISYLNGLGIDEFYADRGIEIDGFNHCTKWIYTELLCFYLWIATAVLFLFLTSCRGICGVSKRTTIKHRYRHDAMEYYLKDIEWIAFNFVMLMNNTCNLYVTFGMESVDMTDEMRVKETKHLSFFSLLVFGRLLCFYFTGTYRDIDRKIMDYGNKT